MISPKPKAMHMARQWGGAQSTRVACGRAIGDRTTDPRQVTCQKCLKTVYVKVALNAQEKSHAS